MIKIKIPYKEFISTLIILFLLGLVVISIFLSINRYWDSLSNGSKVLEYLKNVPLEKIESQKAKQVIENLNKEDVLIEPNKINNPFKDYEILSDVEATNTET
ncbi:hypothetical protein KKF32_01750 [Patescibacteria group bacterium]|nr:hypothetical protein [Patescibacteria group bacterium]